MPTSNITPEQIRAAIHRQSQDQGPPGPVQTCGKVLTWVEVRLLDMEGNPVAGKRYSIKLPDGSVKQGSLDNSGRARVDGIEPGTCMISFPELDEEAWDRV
jgi:hypothetical protein